MQAGRITIYSKRIEILHLLLPFLVLLGIAYVQFFMSYSENIEAWVRFISGFVFLNVVHTAFSFFLIVCLPEFRALMATKWRKEGIWFFARGIAIFVLTVCAFDYAFESLERNSFIAVALLYSCLASHHELKQVYGISRMYDRDGENPHLKIEKNLYRAQIGLAVFMRVMSYAQTSFIYLEAIRNFVFLTAIICPVTLIVLSLRQANIKDSNKCFFISRLLLNPLGVFWPIFRFNSFFTHGMEYLFFVRSQTQASRFRWSVPALLFLIGVTAIAAFTLLPKPHGGIRWVIDRNFNISSSALNLIGAISAATTILHYYMDRVLFRMSDSDVREHIGPLMKESVTRLQPHPDNSSAPSSPQSRWHKSPQATG